MRRPLLLLLLFAAPLAAAQLSRTPGATEYYHNAAKAYVDGETEQAVQQAETGLALDPDNAKLKKLLDLLRQQKPPQDGDDGQQDDQSDSGDQEGEDDQGQNQQDGQNGERPDSENNAERDGTQQKRDQPQDQQEGASGGERDRQRPNQPTPADAGAKSGSQMSAAQAQRLLDAVGAEEELLVSRMRRPSRMRRSDRDW